MVGRFIVSIALLVCAVGSQATAQTDGPWIDAPGVQCPATQQICAIWRGFRRQQPYPYQGILVQQLSDSEWAIVLSEPPQGGERAVLAVRQVFGDAALEVERMRVPTGVDGWLEDVVFRARVQETQTADVISGRTMQYWEGPVDLVNRLLALHQLAQGDQIGFAIDRLDQAVGTAALDIAVSPLDVRSWASDATLTWTSLSQTSAALTWARMRSGQGPGVFASSDGQLIALRVPASAQLEEVRAAFRRFAAASDLIIGSVRAIPQGPAIVFARARRASYALLPPLRFESFAALVGNRDGDLYQSYERQRLFAGRLSAGPHAGWDWAPIAMSPAVEDSDFGTLLNIADQILKSWSQAGGIEYRGFESYPRPRSFPFGARAASDVFAARYNSTSLVFNWNTDGYSTLSVVPQFGEVITAARSAALPVTYIPSGAAALAASDDAEAETAYGYFNSLSDPVLVRVAQYVLLHQITRSYLSGLRGAPQLRAQPRTQLAEGVLRAEAQDWLQRVQASGGAAMLSPASFAQLNQLISERGIGQVAGFLTDRQAGSAQFRSIDRRWRRLESEGEAIRAERDEAFDAYCAWMSRHGGYDRTTAANGRECGIDVSLPSDQVARLEAQLRPIDARHQIAKRSADEFQMNLLERARQLQTEAANLNRQLSVVDDISRDVSAAAGFSRDVSTTLDRVLTATSGDATSGPIRTPTVVISQNIRDVYSVGGHNIGGAPTRVEVGGARAAILPGSQERPVLRIPEAALGSANRFAGAAERGRPIASVSSEQQLAAPRAQVLRSAEGGEPARAATLLDAAVRQPLARPLSASNLARARAQALVCDCSVLIMRTPDEGIIMIRNRPAPPGEPMVFATETQLVQALAEVPERARLGFIDVSPNSADAIARSAGIIAARRGPQPELGEVYGVLLGSGRGAPPRGPTYTEITTRGPGPGGGERARLMVLDDLTRDRASILAHRPAWPSNTPASVVVRSSGEEVSAALAEFGATRANPQSAAMLADITLPPAAATDAVQVQSIRILGEFDAANPPSATQFQGLIVSESTALAAAGRSTIREGMARIAARMRRELSAIDLRFFVRTNRGDLQAADLEELLDMLGTRRRFG